MLSSLFTVTLITLFNIANYESVILKVSVELSPHDNNTVFYKCYKQQKCIETMLVP